MVNTSRIHGDAFWEGVLLLLRRYDCVSRACANFNGDLETSDWARLPFIPAAGYVEHTRLGPVPVRNLCWVEISSSFSYGPAPKDGLVNVDIAEALAAMDVSFSLERATIRPPSGVVAETSPHMTA
jgi:hypothetical protein